MCNGGLVAVSVLLQATIIYNESKSMKNKQKGAKVLDYNFNILFLLNILDIHTNIYTQIHIYIYIYIRNLHIHSNI